MTTLSNAYPTEAEPRRAIEAMRATGVSPRPSLPRSTAAT
jgi:hypothetical protein